MLASASCFLVFATATAAASPVVDHNLDIRLDVPNKRIEVLDIVTLDSVRPSVEFVLHAGMSPRVDEGTVEISAVPPGGAVPTELVRVKFHQPTSKFHVRYAGVIDHAPSQVATEHQRSFQETPGTISDQGVYLSAASLWIPRLVEGGAGEGNRVNELMTAQVHLDAGRPPYWRMISEGDDHNNEEVTWYVATPTDDLHLVVGPFVEFKERKRGVDVKIYLRHDGKGAPPADAAALASKYIEVTGQYLAIYNDMIGPYPYGKFALVENFWETGYGMPSFTLLGSQVVRFPFILHTSWPHELLHNWWGNGVFVKPGTGNWSEGLTAYLADHLHAEHEGKADEYRRTTLQKYQDFVSVDASQDFPLVEFESRFSAASEAVGYGKWMMVVHMLRKKLGDDAFKRALQRFWKQHRFERATFDDVRAAMQAESKEDLTTFFDAWTKRTGAPRIRFREVRATTNRGESYVDVVLEQTQRTDPFPMDVPVVVTGVRGGVQVNKVTFDGKSRTASGSFATDAAVARVDIDPYVDTFRELLPGETAPSMSKGLGAKKAVFVLPTLALGEERVAWTAFAQSICPKCSVVDDKSLDALPADASVWVLGYGNQLRGGAAAGVVKYQARLDDVGFLPPGPWTRDRLKTERTEPGKTSLVLALSNPRNPQHALVFVGAHKASAIPLLAKKVPHYGKYGYLGFTGDAVENSLKGQWTPDASPMTVHFGKTPVALTTQFASVPLAKLPPPIDADRMLDYVQKLAALNGRESDKDVDAAIATVRRSIDAPEGQAIAGNWVARVPGRDRSLGAVVLGAHIDHLGVIKNKVYPGADDNASGVAVLTEVSRLLRKQGPFLRDIVLVLFVDEENGLKGSRDFVKSLGAEPKSKVHSMVNLDTVGRRPAPGAKLLVLDGQSASEWVHIARGVGFTTGVGVELAKEGGGASDQQAFIEAGIPAIQLFGGPHTDYHRPTDTADKVDAKALVDTAVVAREIVAYLADRKEPLSSSGAAGPGATGGRRVSLGTVPDMTFAGPGVRVDDVVAGSPAATVGVRKGDVLLRFDGAAVNDLRGYSELLKTKKPGEKVKIVVLRDGKEVPLEATLVER